MDQLSSQGSGLNIEVLGTVFAVTWGPGVQVEQRAAARRAWSRCLTATPTSTSAAPSEPTPSHPYSASICFDSRTRGVHSRQLRNGTFEGLAEQLTSELTLAAILEQAGQLTMLHACGVADPDTGKVIALVAKSGTGKTTASAVLATTLGYVTDETVAIRHDGSVVPYPKPLSVKQPSSGSPKIQTGPDQLGLVIAPEKLHIDSIVLLSRRPTDAGYAYPELEIVPMADAVLELIPDTSSQASHATPLQSLCRLIDSVGGVRRVTYSEARDLPDVLRPLFHNRRPAQARSSWKGRSATGDVAGTIPDAHVQRTPYLDAVEIDGDLLVLQETEIRRLTGIAPTMWAAAHKAVTVETLLADVGKVHGLPEGHRQMLDNAVDALVSAKILARGVS